MTVWVRVFARFGLRTGIPKHRSGPLASGVTLNTLIRTATPSRLMVISRPVPNRLKWVLIPIIAAGCQFSPGSDGADTDTDTDTDAAETGDATSAVSTASSTEETSDTASTATATTTTEGSTTDSPSSGSSTAGDDTSTGSEPACEPFAQWVWADDVPDDDTTFSKTDSMNLPLFEDEPVVFLRSLMSGVGTAELAFEVPCTDEVVFWALVWDADGNGVDNADAYQFGLNQTTEEVAEEGSRWEYGCDNEERRWAWYPIRDTGRACDPGETFELPLEAGPHHLQINNPEAISNNPEFNFTGLAALVVTNDPAYDPVADYDPAPGG